MQNSIVLIMFCIIIMGCSTKYRVIDLNDNPVADATVTVRGQNEYHYEILTGLSGEFEINGWQIGGLEDKSVTIKKKGFYEKYLSLSHSEEKIVRLVPLNNPTANPGIIYKSK